MKTQAWWRVPAAFLGGLILMWSMHRAAADERTPIAIIRIYTGPDGLSHMGTIQVKFQPSRLRAGLDESEARKFSGGRLMRWPRGYVWEWHNASERQYVITISGRAEVEVSGGQKFQAGPGQIVLAEDLTGKGHITRSIGSEDLVLLLLPITGE